MQWTYKKTLLLAPFTSCLAKAAQREKIGKWMQVKPLRWPKRLQRSLIGCLSSCFTCLWTWPSKQVPVINYVSVCFTQTSWNLIGSKILFQLMTLSEILNSWTIESGIPGMVCLVLVYLSSSTWERLTSKHTAKHACHIFTFSLCLWKNSSLHVKFSQVAWKHHFSSASVFTRLLGKEVRWGNLYVHYMHMCTHTYWMKFKN